MAWDRTRETRASYRARRKAFHAQLPGGLDALRALVEETGDPDDPRGDDPAFVDALYAEIRSFLAAKAWIQRQSHATLEAMGRSLIDCEQEVS